MSSSLGDEELVARIRAIKIRDEFAHAWQIRDRIKSEGFEVSTNRIKKLQAKALEHTPFGLAAHTRGRHGRCVRCATPPSSPPP